MRGQGWYRPLWWVMVTSIVALLLTTAILKRDYGEEDLLLAVWVAYAPVGAVIAHRRPDNAIGWVFLSAGLVASLGALCLVVVTNALQDGPPVSTAAVLAALFTTWMIFPLVLLTATFTFLLYPSGLLSPRWRPILWLGFVLLGLYGLAPFVMPTVEVAGTGAEAQGIEVPNPVLLTDDIIAPDGAFFVSLSLITFCSLAAVCSALIRAWRSTGVERLQMRLFAFSVVLLLGVLWPAQYLATHGHSLGRYILLSVAFALIPVSCGIAVLRYHLYDIDRVIGRTTAYALVTGVLLGVYVLVVTSVGRLLPESSELAVAVATLTAAALFRPVLGWARGVVARRFNREQYDADHVVEEFARGLRDEVDSSVVQGELLAVLERTLQPSGSALWLRGPKP